jgi:hypothetical protein
MRSVHIRESANDPYAANFQVWSTKTKTHLKAGPPSHNAALNSLEAALEMITQHKANLLSATRKNDSGAAKNHEHQIAKLQGVHDGILSGLSHAGFLHPRAARRKAFKKDLITESLLSSLAGEKLTPRPVVGVWFGEGSATDHPAYQQGMKAAEKMADEHEIEHLKNSAVKAHEKHVQLALNHEDKLRDMEKNQGEDHPEAQEERNNVKKHKELADTFHAFARGIHRAQTE